MKLNLISIVAFPEKPNGDVCLCENLLLLDMFSIFGRKGEGQSSYVDLKLNAFS